jgi:hypothetical protein
MHYKDMVFPINGANGPKATDKAKAKARVGVAGGPSFADALAEAQATAELTPALPTAPLSGGLALPALVPDEEANDQPIPKDTKGQTAQLLKHLRDLADAALGGPAQANMQKLQQLANAVGADETALSPAARQAVNEARTRAAVEAAKQQPK